jgi:hypothetical protein
MSAKHWFRALAFVIPGALSLAVARPASAQVSDQPREEWPSSPGARTVSIDFGIRTGFIADAGFDPYSTNDVLNQGSLGATATIFRRGPLSLAVGGRWEWGAASAKARAADAKLWSHRFSVPVEVRWQLESALQLFARLAPGAMYQSVTLDDPSSPTTLRSTGWVVSTDASLGAALLLGPYRASPRTPRWWLVGDAGYGFSTSRDVTPTPEAADAEPRRYGTVDLPRLALRGGFVRLAVATSF